MMKCKGKLTIKTFLTLMARLEVQAGFPGILKNEITTVTRLLNASWTHTEGEPWGNNCHG